MNKQLFTITFISLIIGFMIAVQFQTINDEPKVRDTRDNFQLRQDLLKEKEAELTLLEEIRSTNDKLDQYANDERRIKEKVLEKTIIELKEAMGLTSIKGTGIILTIDSIDKELLLGEKAGKVNAGLIRRLINELNMYGAQEVSINGNRHVNTSAIRDINMETKIDGNALNTLPLEVKVLAKDEQAAGELYNRMKVSNSADDFFAYNLLITVKKSAEITIPAYKKNMVIRYMEPVMDKGGDS
ncbi:DUF881 domain-containing protein [Niallia nealsonii]|nr:DUF881 domain-containing protein [Niallia nealsonii]